MRSPVVVLLLLVCAFSASGQLAVHQCAQTAMTVSEGAGTANFELTRTGNTSQATTGTIYSPWGVSDPLSGTYFILFAPGETAKTLTVPIHDNAYYSSQPQRVNVMCGGSGPGTSSSTSIITVTVKDDEPYPAFIAPESVEFTETDAAQSVTIPISFVPEFRYPTIYPWIKHGTATDKDVVLQTWSYSSLTLTIPGDDLPENDETATLYISGDVTKEIKITIVDDDRPPFPYTFSRENGYAFRENETGTIGVQRSGSLAESVALTLSVRSENGQLWYALPVVLAAGQAATEIALPSFEDGEYTGVRNAVLELVLENWVGARSTLIIDDDEPQPSLSIGDGSVIEGNLDEHKRLEIPVTLSGPLATTIHAGVTATHVTTSASDVVLTPQSVQIPAGEVTGFATFDVIGDIDLEENETFQVMLANCCDGLVRIGRRTATATIVNDDSAPAETVYRLPFTTTQFREDGSWITVPIRRFGRLDLPASVTLRLTSSDARVFLPRKVWFAPNETAHDARFYISNDLYSGDADVVVDLIVGGQVVQSATVRIIETNETPKVSLSGGHAREGLSSSVPFTIRVSPRSTQPVSVHLHAVAGTATNGADFPPYDATIEVPPLASSYRFEVPIYDDLEPEKTEDFEIRITSATGARPSDFPWGFGAIYDNDSVYVESTLTGRVGATGTLTVVLPIPAPAQDTIGFATDTFVLDVPQSVVVPKGATRVTVEAVARHSGRITVTITPPKFLNAPSIVEPFELYEVSTITLNPESVTLAPGAMAVSTLRIAASPYDSVVESADPGVAVGAIEWTGQDYGLVVYGVSPGKTEIRVSFGGSTARVPVVVAEPAGSNPRVRSVRH